jgi:sulfur carrier protein
MEMIINGEKVQVAAASTVSELLIALGYAGKRIAVEKNGEIVPKSTHAQATISPTDKIEIVVAVGGG